MVCLGRKSQISNCLFAFYHENAQNIRAIDLICISLPKRECAIDSSTFLRLCIRMKVCTCGWTIYGTHVKIVCRKDGGLSFFLKTIDKAILCNV